MQANGRTSQRSYDCENRRDAGALLGKLVQYKSPGKEQWEGLSLKTERKEAQPIRSTAYWRDFLGGRRTLDPSYPRTQEHSGKRIPLERHNSCIISEGAMLASQSSEVFGYRTKAVMLNGYVRNDHRTSKDNTLNSAANTSEAKPALGRRGSEASLHSYASQITNLPGAVYRVEPSAVRVPRYRSDSISSIATLPGPKVIPLEAELHNPQKKFVRCTNTSQETEEVLGPFPAKAGPRLSLLPTASNLPTYHSIGRDNTNCTRKFIYKELRQSSEEVNYNKGVRGRGTEPLRVALKLA